jgi:uncharacterized protein YbjT (DUF2867 family)
MTSRSCLILGATGMVGGHLLRLLLDDPAYSSVAVLTRRTLGLTEPRLVEHVVDFDRPETYRAHTKVDDVFCCLGTTIKKAGSQEAFRKVDLEYPIAIAQAAADAGAGQYLIVTAVGADPKSGIFYNRVKGEVEEALRGLPFARGVKIFRPSMLLGERGESRPAERVGVALMAAAAPLFVGGLRPYRAIDGRKVAHAMWKAATTEPHGTRVYEGASLFALAERG